MRYTIISDIHSNLPALRQFFREYDHDSRLICLGDTIGYGASPRECLEMTRKHATVMLAGNHEAMLFDRSFRFNPAAEAALDWTLLRLSREQLDFCKKLQGEMVFEDKYYLVHGTPGAPYAYLTDQWQYQKAEYKLRENGIEICFFGHTHRAGYFENGHFIPVQEGFLQLFPGQRWFINPGSIGQPRDGDPRLSYCIFDDHSQRVEFLRKNYDIESEIRLINKAGLPEILGTRLKGGH